LPISFDKLASVRPAFIAPVIDVTIDTGSIVTSHRYE